MTDAETLENYVDGRWVRSSATAHLDVPDPSNGALLARVPRSGASDVDAAVRAARKAFPAWRAVPVA